VKGRGRKVQRRKKGEIKDIGEEGKGNGKGKRHVVKVKGR
jgi:hypothetical protein